MLGSDNGKYAGEYWHIIFYLNVANKWNGQVTLISSTYVNYSYLNYGAINIWVKSKGTFRREQVNYTINLQISFNITQRSIKDHYQILKKT